MRLRLKSIFVVASVVSLSLVIASHATLAQDIDTPQQTKPTISLGVGWERLRLGPVEFGGKYDVRTFPNLPLVAPNRQHDGAFDGLRIDLSGQRPVQLFGQPNTWIGVSAFHAFHNESSNTSCTTVNSAGFCDGVPLFDPSSTTNQSLGSGTGEVATYTGEVATYNVDRDVRHWGVSIEAGQGSLSGSRPGLANWQPRLGIGYRTIDQELDLTSSWSRDATSWQTYHESLRTHYLGAFLGLDGRYNLSDRLVLKLSGEAGLYWAHTAYDGDLNQSDDSGSTVQALRLTRECALRCHCV